ncbi:hypothetical protein D1AOALGA4SA_10389 [Olavius algarvensis Delta 1 endosymbiont]|nr:hypothetical protein D1AOALGA4SA_10389 [Olavius algarvensis Delta 1 endosymbiont]
MIHFFKSGSFEKRKCSPVSGFIPLSKTYLCVLCDFAVKSNYRVDA